VGMSIIIHREKSGNPNAIGKKVVMWLSNKIRMKIKQII
jgi:hypothetical protein